MSQQNPVYSAETIPSVIESDCETLTEQCKPQDGTSLSGKKGPMNAGSLRKLLGVTCATVIVAAVVIAVLLTLTVTVTLVLQLQLRNTIQALDAKVEDSNQDINCELYIVYSYTSLMFN